MAEMDESQLKQLAENILNQLGLSGAPRRNLVIKLLKMYHGDYCRALWRAKRVFLGERLSQKLIQLKSAEESPDPSQY